MTVSQEESRVTDEEAEMRGPGCLLGLPEHRKLHLHVCPCLQPGMGGEGCALGKRPYMTCATLVMI